MKTFLYSVAALLAGLAVAGYLIFVLDTPYAAFGKEVFKISEGHAKTMIDPHSVTDNLRWKTVSMVTRSGISHELSLSISSQVDNTTQGPMLPR